MKDNQMNGHKNNKEAYCPNMFFDNGTVSIGEFITLDDAMNFPIMEIWCINRTEDNKFQSYLSQGTRILIICSWNRGIQDPLKFVVALIHKGTAGMIYYWDMNDLPLYPEERKNQYEGSLGDDATYTLYQIVNNNTIKEKRNMKQTIKLRESELKRMIAESVKRVLREHSRDIDDDNYFGGGLPDRYFDDDAPDDDRISQKQITQLDNIADAIADIANNTSDEAELLFQAIDNISEFTSRYK